MRLLPCIALMMALCACATSVTLPYSVQAAWYLEAESKGVYVALLNEGSAEVALRKVIINPDVDGKGGLSWEAPRGSFLRPGRLMVLKLSSFAPSSAPQDCVVPVVVLLESESAARIRATLTGRMPSSLPEEWLGCSAGAKP